MMAVSSILVENSLDKVYDIAATYPLFVSFFNRREVVESSDTFTSVRVGMKRYGMDFKWAGKGNKIARKEINYIQTEGLVKGMKADWIFTPVSENKTIVDIKTTLKVDFFMFGSIIEKQMSSILVESTTRRILEELKRTAEAGIKTGGR